MSLKLQNQVTFATHIENLVKEKKLTYMEAVIEYVNLTGIDFEKIKKLISPKIKSEIENEAIYYNMLPDRKNDAKLDLE